jgi:hypothetical protein
MGVRWGTVPNAAVMVLPSILHFETQEALGTGARYRLWG